MRTRRQFMLLLRKAFMRLKKDGSPYLVRAAFTRYVVAHSLSLGAPAYVWGCRLGGKAGAIAPSVPR